MLDGAPILICEDEPFIALDLVASVEDAGGRAVGPAATVREALALLATQEVVGAILDVNLSDGEVTPVAERLLDAGIPLVVQTGVGLPAALGDRIAPDAVFSKPVLPQKLIRRLEDALAGTTRR